MADTNQVDSRTGTFGDAAVDGLLVGGAAGILMAIYLVAAGLVRGDAPIAAIVVILGRFDPGPARAALTGALVHLAVAGVYGLVYGLGRHLWNHSQRLGRAPGWLTGTAYGLLIWVVAQT